MAGRWRWRAAVLVTVGLVLGAQQMQASANGRDDEGRSGADQSRDSRDRADRARRQSRDGRAQAMARGVERYNPDIDGNRVVFTQVTRRRDGSTTAGVWSRDLASGRETLVADVATGEPYPVASPGWTVWSEVGTGETPTSVVRARSTANRSRAIDVYVTDYPFGYDALQAARQLVSVDVSGNRVATVGSLAPGAAGQLVRFDLPDTRPTYVDVMSTSGYVVDPGVSQSGATSVIGLDGATRFSIVDGAGAVIAAPTVGDCFPVGSAAMHPVIDGNRVAILGFCAGATGFGPVVSTCTLPCDVLQDIPITVPFSWPSRLSLSGSLVTWASDNGFDRSTVWVLDVATGGPPTLVHTASGTIGPRVSISGRRLVWDETTSRNGTTSSEIYMHDLDTGRTVILADRGGVVPVNAATGPLRLDPDVRDGKLAYTEVARDASAAGVWTRTLGGTPTLVSTMATDGSAPRLGTGWLAWNTRDAGSAVDRVVATNGAGPLVDVYSTDLSGAYPYSPEHPATVGIDVAGSRVTVNGYIPVTGFGNAFAQQAVFDRTLPGGALRYLAPIVPNSFGGLPPASSGRTNGTYTAAIDYSAGGAIDLYDGAGTLRQVSPPPSGSSGLSCAPTALDLTDTRLVAASVCNGDPSTLWSCTLPCLNGFTDRLALPSDADPFSPGFEFPAYFGSMSAGGDLVAVSRVVYNVFGRYGDRVTMSTRLELYDIRRGSGPVVLAVESGTVSEPRVDGNTVTWSVDRWDGVRTGTVYVHNVPRGRTTSF